jgi:hypothetical protein
LDKLKVRSEWNLTENRVRQWAFVLTVLKLQVPLSRQVGIYRKLPDLCSATANSMQNICLRVMSCGFQLCWSKRMQSGRINLHPEGREPWKSLPTPWKTGSAPTDRSPASVQTIAILKAVVLKIFWFTDQQNSGFSKHRSQICFTQHSTDYVTCRYN